jgi:MFS family permease
LARRLSPLLLSVYLPTLIVSFCNGLLLPVLPLYAKSFGVSYSLVGLVLAAEGLGTLVSDVPAGLLLRRIGRKPAMLLGVGCVALSALAMTWARTFPELVAYRLIAGVGDALWGISRHAYIADVTLVRERGRVISIFGGIGRLGTFIGPAVGGTLGAALGLRAPFFLFAALAALATLVAALFLRETDPPSARRAGEPGHLLRVLRGHYRELAAAGSAQVFAQMIRASRHIIIPVYGADVVGLDVQSLGWVLSISSAIDMSMFYPAGVIMDRFGRKYASVPSFLIQALGMALIPLSSTFSGLLLATTVLGLGNGIGSGTMMTLGADLAPKESMGEFLGLWRLIGDAGSAGGPLAVGRLADLLGLRMAAFAMSGVGLLAVLTLVFLVRETLEKH